MASRQPLQLLSPQDMVRAGLCIGCGSCVTQAHTAEAHIAFDRFGQYTPRGASAWLRHWPARLARTCPFLPAARNEDELATDLFPEAAAMPP